jgi:hypothetical protein
MKHPLPDVYAVQRLGDRWLMLAPSEQTLARTFDRRELRAVDVEPAPART